MPAKTALIRTARARLKTRLKAVSDERDQLRELLGDVEDLISSCDDAIDGLETAITALSRFA